MTTYIVFTEQGRIKRRTNGCVMKVTSKGTKRITDFEFSPGSNRGLMTEVVAALVKVKELPKKALTMSGSGYIDYDYKKQKNYELVMIEGRGLNYLTIN